MKKKIIIVIAIVAGFFGLVILKYEWGRINQKNQEFNFMVDVAKHDAGANAYIGACFFVGYNDLNLDKKEAVKWMYKAAERDLYEAELFLGTVYFLGEGLDKDKGAGLRLFFNAVSDSKVSLDEAGVKGIDLSSESNKSALKTYFEKEKESGNSRAQKVLELLNDDLSAVNKTAGGLQIEIKKALEDKDSWVKEAYYRALLKN